MTIVRTTDQPIGYRVVAGFDGSYPRAILTDATGRVIVNVPALPLPAGAATEATQLLNLAQLQFINAALGGILRVDNISTGGATEATLALVKAGVDLLSFPLHSMGLDSWDTTVISSVLPTGAATSANQSTEITSLQLIDDLRAALASVATDSIRIAGAQNTAARQNASNELIVQAAGSTLLGNILTGYNASYHETGSDNTPAAGPVNKSLSTVAAGEVWVIQNMWALNNTTASKSVSFQLSMGDATFQRLGDVTAGTSTSLGVMIHGEWWLAAGMNARVQFIDNLANDHLSWGISGYKFKV